MRGCLHMAAAGGFVLAAMFGLSASAEEQGGGASDRDTFTMVLDGHSAQPVLGKEVRGSNGEDIGRIIDVIVDASGHPRAAVIDFGGFLGVGSRKIVVVWGALQFSRADSDPIQIALTRDQVKAAPEYRNGKPVVVLGAISPTVAPDM